MVSKSTITIKDVAKAAGVSTQTVSRVINNRPDVAPKTRAMVQKVVRELGYAPNYFARSLSSGKTNTLGVIGFGLEYFGPSNVLTGISKEADQYGFSVLLSIIEHLTEEQIKKVLNQFVAQQVLGIIWAVPGFTDTMKMIAEVTTGLPVPLVLLNREPLQKNIVVSVDNRAGARLATEHLLEQKYRKVGIITGPLTWWEAQERLAGWREVMQQFYPSGLDELVFEGDWTVESGDCGFEALYNNHSDLDAIFVSNDQMALGVIQAANRNGLNIPQDLGIVGFDNIPESKFFFPPLTTINQPTRKLGALAVARLYECLQHEDIDECFHSKENVIRPELIVRQSSRYIE